MALIDRKTKLSRGILPGDFLCFYNHAPEMGVMISDKGEENLLWKSKETKEYRIPFRFDESEIRWLAVLLCEAAGLKGEIKIFRSMDKLILIKVIS